MSHNFNDALKLGSVELASGCEMWDNIVGMGVFYCWKLDDVDNLG